VANAGRAVVFELSQELPEKYDTFDPRKKRSLLEIVCSNLYFDGANVVPVYRKPFNILAEGLSLISTRGDPCLHGLVKTVILTADRLKRRTA